MYLRLNSQPPSIKTNNMYLLLLPILLLSITQCNILVPVDTIALLVSPHVARM